MKKYQKEVSVRNKEGIELLTIHIDWEKHLCDFICDENNFTQEVENAILDHLEIIKTMDKKMKYCLNYEKNKVLHPWLENLRYEDFTDEVIDGFEPLEAKLYEAERKWVDGIELPISQEQDLQDQMDGVVNQNNNNIAIECFKELNEGMTDEEFVEFATFMFYRTVINGFYTNDRQLELEKLLAPLFVIKVQGGTFIYTDRQSFSVWEEYRRLAS